MSNCNCFPEIDPQFLADLETETGKPEWHALYTVVLGSLVEDGVFDWTKPELDWSSAAYDAGQYARVCEYFINRYRYQEIAVLPVKQWFNELRTRLVYELMPKYRVLYGEEEKQYNLAFGGLEKGWDIRDTTGNETGSSEEHATKSGTNGLTVNETRHDDEYYKGRDIESDYPETLLSSNADYISSGNDTENERIKDGTTTTTNSGTTSDTEARTGETEKAATENMRSSFEHEKEVDTATRIETLNAYMEAVTQLDKRLLDELEVLFIQVYTANVNGL